MHCLDVRMRDRNAVKFKVARILHCVGTALLLFYLTYLLEEGIMTLLATLALFSARKGMLKP